MGPSSLVLWFISYRTILLPSKQKMKAQISCVVTLVFHNSLNFIPTSNIQMINYGQLKYYLLPLCIFWVSFHFTNKKEMWYKSMKNYLLWSLETYLNSFLAGHAITVTISHSLMIVKSHSQRQRLHLTLNIPKGVLWGPQRVIFCDPAVTISTNLLLIFVCVLHQLKINIM